MKNRLNDLMAKYILKTRDAHLANKHTHTLTQATFKVLLSATYKKIDMVERWNKQMGMAVK